MSDDEIKWKIGKIEKLFETYIEDFKENELKFHQYVLGRVQAVVTVRNYYLSAVAGAISILLGLAGVGVIDTNSLMMYLTGSIVIGILIFFVYTILIHKTAIALEEIAVGYSDGRSKLHEALSFFILASFEIKKAEPESVTAVAAFVTVLNRAVRLYLFKSYKKAEKLFLLEDTVQSEMREACKMIKSGVKLLKEDYNKINQKKLPQFYIDQMDKIFMDNKKIIKK